MFQIAAPNGSWVDTGIHIPAPLTYVPLEFEIEYGVDYGSRVSSVFSVTVGGVRAEVPETLWHIPGRQEGWQPNQIVTQLQQCSNAYPGGYTLRFTNLGYVLR